MIYIISGNDIKKRNAYLKKLCNDGQINFLNQTGIKKEMLFNYAESISLFGDSQIIVLENLTKDKNIEFSSEELDLLNKSKTAFVFLEEKLLASDVKKYKKYAVIEDFNIQEVKQTPKVNVFGIADAFSQKDKMTTWILYREAVSQGVSPEEISGIIFWKIKTLLLNGTKFFSANELKNKSSELVSIYHRAHRGDIDFIISLEQFILSSLVK